MHPCVAAKIKKQWYLAQVNRPTQEDVLALREAAVEAARSASLVLLNWVDAANDDLDIRSKGDGSPVSNADFESHAVIAKALASTGIPILSEEGRLAPWEERQHWDWVWLVDPLDGTDAFVRHRSGFAVNIALCGPEGPALGVVADPCGGLIYSGILGHGARKETLQGKLWTPLSPAPPTLPYRLVTSRNERATLSELLPPGFRLDEVQSEPVSGALKFCLVASGEADMHSRTGPYMEWDCAAGDGILRSMGLCVYDAQTGEPLRYNKPNLWVRGLWTSRIQR